MVLSSIPVFPEAVLFSLLSAQDKLSKAGTKDLSGKIFSFKDFTQHVMLEHLDVGHFTDRSLIVGLFQSRTPKKGCICEY